MSDLTLTLRQAAQVGDRARSDFVLGTRDYLPGAVVRGAFAAAWIAAHGAPASGASSRAQFLQLFEGRVRFGPLFGRAQPVPLSVAGHKYRPEPQCRAVEYDRAARDDALVYCPDCRALLESRKTARGAEAGDTVVVRRRTSVAIAASGVAWRGQIVTRDTLEAGQSFRGTLHSDDQDLLGVLASLGPVRVGGRRTTHGTADVHITDGAPPPTAERRADGLLIVRLRSPGIFTDDQGRPSPDPREAELAEVLGCPARVRRRWYRWETVGGWHIATGLPKPSEVAVAAGSTYLIEPGGTVTDDALAMLGNRGLGLRRHEGFGDLAPRPSLIPGREDIEAENARRKKMLDEIAPLRGLQVTSPGLWEELVRELPAYAGGNQAARSALDDLAGRMDRYAAGALRTLLAQPLPDIAYAAGELSHR